MTHIKFKSLPEHYNKEKSGIKNNTTRWINDKDMRFTALMNMAGGDSPMENIEIENSETGESFVRQIKDVTVFSPVIIITWRA